ncbi:hypothetical protein [Paraburkholderia phytofirmans]|uniref:hypothetical protein n=1 Tax=Paraburkholderia phytofirmans TaxID=261302 RepID=UPI0000E77121|nr:hypothetical protein [Paraburkholderia phytofirmans]
MNYLSALEQATVQLSTSYTTVDAINSLPTLFLAAAAIHAIVKFSPSRKSQLHRPSLDGKSGTNVSAIDMATDCCREDLCNNERRS